MFWNISLPVKSNNGDLLFSSNLIRKIPELNCHFLRRETQVSEERIVFVWFSILSLRINL